MKIVVCASMAFAKEMVGIRDFLVAKGHEVILPHSTELYANGELARETSKESAENKIKHDLFRYYYNLIQECDAILVANYDKKGVLNYVGGNTLIEMSFAHVLDKKIFMVNPIPDLSYSDEIVGMQPFILEGDLDKVV